MHIVVAGHVNLEDGNNRDEIIAGAKPYIEAAWAELGCLAYNWTPDPFLTDRIHVFEEWSGEKELADHLSGQPYRDMLAHLGGAGIKSSVTQKYKIEHIEPVYDERGVPRANFFTEK